jgi:hypothetical protein
MRDVRHPGCVSSKEQALDPHEGLFLTIGAAAPAAPPCHPLGVRHLVPGAGGMRVDQCGNS